MNLSAIRSLPAKRGVRLALYWIVGLFASLILFGYFGLPPLARWAVESQGSKALGRAVSVGKIGFNPFTLTATVESLKIAEADGKGEFFAFKHLEANVDVSSLWHGGVVLRTLNLDEPKVHVIRGEDLRYNFGDILNRLAGAPKPKEEGEPTRFSLNNIQLSNGSIIFEDQPSKRRHVIERLSIGVPFVSNFPASVDIFQTPRIGAVVNGAPLALEGKLKPFASNREAMLDLALSPFDLTQYFVYLPGKMPVKIEKATLETDLRLTWSQSAAGQKLVVNGTTKLSDVTATELDGSPLAAFKLLSIDVTSLEPLTAPVVAKISKVRFDGLALDVHRGKDGVVNLQRLGSAGSGQGSPATVQSAPAASPAKPPVVMIDSVELNKGALRWSDDAVSGGFKLALAPIDLQVKKFDLGGETPAQINLKAASDTGEIFSHNGEFVLSKGNFNGQVEAGGLSLERLRPYFNDAVGPAGIQGTLAAKADYSVEGAKTTPVIRVTKAGATLTNLAVSAPGEKQPLASVADLHVDGATVDLSKYEVTLGSVGSKDARWRVVRSHEGKINLLEALIPSAQKPSPSARGATSSDKARKGSEGFQSKTSANDGAGPWRISVGQAEIAGWNLNFDDRSGNAPVAMNVQDLGLAVKDWSNKPGSMATAEVKAKVNKKGQLAVAGRFGSEPLKGDLKLDLKAVDLISIQPYVDEHFRVLVTHGAVSAQGALGFDFGRPDRPQARYVGSLSVDDFNSLDQINDTDFMRWKHFAFSGIKFDLAPLSVFTSEVRLEDFYTRLILDAQGRFNVRELATVEDEVTPPTPGQSAPAVAVASAPVVASASAPAASASLPVVKVDRLVLREGHVNYSDRFIKPNYDANLRGVNGTLSGLSTDQASLAQLDLHAKLDGSAPVEVSGQLNPFRHDRFLDIKADVSDVDLTGVSTYSAKYVGYGIEKGKLSMKLEYKIRDRVLTARNQVNLDQLTFGEKVDSPQATKLPVLFAVALMKNSQGEIDVDLPISGTLDDPQFSVGGIIVRVIVNLITKAITAPFSLLGSMFGGGEELSSIDFPAGLAQVTPAAEEKLKSLSKALNDRPALRLEVAGIADPAGDRLGLKRAVLEGRMRALKAAALVKRGQEVADVDRLPIDPQEYPTWLEAVYSAEKIPNKPRNAIGLAKKLPPDEMEKMLLDYLLVSDADVQALGARRAQAVRDWFVSNGLDPDRIFLLNVTNVGGKREGKPVSPRVEFSLK